MRKFGHGSLKRSLVLANTPKVERLDRGPLTEDEKALARASCVYYTDGAGRKRFHGGKALKASQPLGPINPCVPHPRNDITIQFEHPYPCPGSTPTSLPVPSWTWFLLPHGMLGRRWAPTQPGRRKQGTAG